ncbi:DmpA family aminopeptidase [Gracilimonas halophila]|uniref:P1 family peptidase n=1 Tax=Gracilimonas halophila TaxID=1834464 RepID=A0ABW5JJJ0_9BACT
MRNIMRFFLLLLISILFLQTTYSQERQRARDLGIKPGILTPGLLNAITDLEGVKVGHRTIIEGENVRTGVTMILPHGGDLLKSRVPAAVYVGNGFGKALGFTQVQELGELETPIGLTNTLSIHTVANGITDYVLRQPGNENVRSVNPVVGETNDGWLNDIRGRHVNMEHVFQAIDNAKGGPVEEGSVGAGTGTSALGFKGGIGTSSRTLPKKYGGYTVGVLVQSNFGGVLTIGGAPVGEELSNHYMASDVPYDVDGLVMIIVATDAPLLSRNLERLAKRAFLGISRVGGFASNGSGDYVIAFSTSEDVRINNENSGSTQNYTELNNSATSPLFLAAVEATEEAILNSLFMATTISGDRGHKQQALPVDKVLDIMNKYSLLKE